MARSNSRDQIRWGCKAAKQKQIPLFGGAALQGVEVQGSYIFLFLSFFFTVGAKRKIKKVLGV